MLAIKILLLISVTLAYSPLPCISDGKISNQQVVSVDHPSSTLVDLIQEEQTVVDGCQLHRKHQQAANESCQIYEAANRGNFNDTIALSFVDEGEDLLWKYSFEQGIEFRLHTPQEKSLDERLANVIFTSKSINAISVESQVFDLDDPKLEEKYKKQTAGSKVNDELCSIELHLMLSLMDELHGKLKEAREQNGSKALPGLSAHHTSLAQALDSFGRYESGMLGGRYFAHGSEFQCSSTRMILDKQNPESTTKARYCMTRLRLNSLNNHLKALNRNPLKVESTLNTAICIPESCHTQSFEKNKPLLQRLVNSQFKLPDSIYLEENLEMESMTCTVDADSHFSAYTFSAKLLLTFLAGWLATSIYFTFYCHEEQKDTTNPRSWLYQNLSESLNLKKSWQSFIGQSQDEQASKPDTKRVQLDTLNPIKVLGIILVVLGHSSMFELSTSMDIIRSLHVMEFNPLGGFLVGSTVIVDTFFVITGIVICYISIKQFKRSSNSGEVGRSRVGQSSSGIVSFGNQCLQFMLTRYLRLVPLYALVFWFLKSIYINNLIVDAPLWDYGFSKSTPTGGCRQESWITPFTFLAAYQPLSSQCLPQSWSVAGDIFASIVLAPLVVLFSRKHKLAIMLAVSLGLFSNYLLYQSLSIIDTRILESLKNLEFRSLAYMFREASFIYTAPHMRVFAIIIGSLGGYALYQFQANEGNKLDEKWPKWFKGIATKLAFSWIVLVCIAMPTISVLKSNILKEFPIHRYFVLYIMSFGRLLWALANVTIFLRMMTDWKDNYLMRNFSGKFFKSMAKLNYLILLIHVHVINLDQRLQTTFGAFSMFKVCRTFTSNYLISCILSVFIYVLLENPIDKFIKGVLDHVSGASKKVNKNLVSCKGEKHEEGLLKTKGMDIITKKVLIEDLTKL